MAFVANGLVDEIGGLEEAINYAINENNINTDGLRYRYYTRAGHFEFGSLSQSLIYSLLPEVYRYSRALIIFGAFIGFSTTTVIRLVLRLLTNKPNSFSLSIKK
ncbi:MAG: hypothetical protein MI754_03645, partial [Chromatiales bacterium]|nr:hypothetical protein [Chromatiales bacterium]